MEDFSYATRLQNYKTDIKVKQTNSLKIIYLKLSAAKHCVSRKSCKK